MLPSFVNESLEVVMNVHDAFMKGWNEGISIMQVNGLEPSDEVCALVLDIEADARQYSPFEFTAAEFNRAENSDELWEAYEKGVQMAASGQSMYGYAHHSGGVILTRHSDDTTVFLQPGDDAGQFLSVIEKTNEKYTDADAISEYFVGVDD